MLFGQLIFGKTIKIVATEGQILIQLELHPNPCQDQSLQRSQIWLDLRGLLQYISSVVLYCGPTPKGRERREGKGTGSEGRGVNVEFHHSF